MFLLAVYISLFLIFYSKSIIKLTITIILFRLLIILFFPNFF